ncbi:50S ribosomal protein L16 [Candidatus Woesearchaeota archaeon]|nr:50S ribosomal protein L16 [Candidatus Woesearchaeota archaeon]
MAKIRKFTAYRRLKRPYTRTSKFKSKSYIRMTPNPKVVRFVTGDSNKDFECTLVLISKSDLNIRDNALESARQTSNKLLESFLGLNGFQLRVSVYPYHVLREHSLAAGAGADRFSSGMAHPFGKPIGVAARVHKGQTIFQVRVNKQNIAVAKQALERASKKLPCACTIQIVEKKKLTEPLIAKV